MKLHHVEQGSVDWLTLRLGIPTASEFEKIVTPTGKLSKQSRKYAIYLVTETLLNRSLSSISNLEWIARGKELEPAAVKMYEFENEVRTSPVGFITTDDGRIGCSPDRLVDGENAAVELKCPAPHTHVEYMLDGFGSDYMVQAQGQAFVGEFDWIDRYSYHPEMPPVRERTFRDEPFIAKLRAALDEFCDMRDALLEQARATGLFSATERIVTPAEAAYGKPFLHTIIDPWNVGEDEQMPFAAG